VEEETGATTHLDELGRPQQPGRAHVRARVRARAMGRQEVGGAEIAVEAAAWWKPPGAKQPPEGPPSCRP